MSDLEDVANQLDELREMLKATSNIILWITLAFLFLMIGVLFYSQNRNLGTVRGGDGGQVTIMHMDGAAVIARAHARGYYTTSDMAKLEDVTSDTIRRRCVRGEYPGATRDAESNQWKIPLEAKSKDEPYDQGRAQE